MRRFWYVGIVLVVVSVITVAATAQVQKGKSRLALIRQIMTGLVHPNCTALEQAAKEAPTNFKAWEALATNAALLNEASYMLMDDGRCPDAEWAKAAQTLRAGSAAVLAKIETKEAAGVSSEVKKMVQACTACHAAHRN